MALHYWNGSSWQIVNNSTGFPYEPEGANFRIWDGSNWIYADNAKVWNGSTWKGFLDQVQLSDDTAQFYGGGFGAGEAEWAIYLSGDVIYTGNPGGYPWIVNPANAGQYEILVTKNFGDFLEGTSSPLDTWLDLGSNTYVWRIFKNEFEEDKSVSLSATIRHKITQTTVAQNTIFLTVSDQPFPEI
jgi:hypothetical protein